jgi:hypothetical protein
LLNLDLWKKYSPKKKKYDKMLNNGRHPIAPSVKSILNWKLKSQNDEHRIRSPQPYYSYYIGIGTSAIYIVAINTTKDP